MDLVEGFTIDLGTTQTTVGYIENGKIATLDSGSGKHVFPTVVSIGTKIITYGEGTSGVQLSNMKMLIGRKEQELKALNLDKYRFGMDYRDGGNELEVIKPGKQMQYFPLNQLVTGFIKSLLPLLEKRVGKTYKDVVITVPARFGAKQRECYKKMVEDAGLTVKRMLTESTAAAIGFVETQEVRPGSTIVVYDLGGGTFDTSIIRITEKGNYEVLASTGHNNIGGEKFDRCLMEYVKKRIIETKPGIELSNKEKVITKFLKSVKGTKETLSTQESAKLNYASIVANSVENEYLIDLTQKEVESVIKDDIKMTVKLVKEMIDSLRNVTVDKLILVGGSSSIPLVRREIENCFKAQIQSDSNFIRSSPSPKEIVCTGAIYALNRNIDELLIHEITSYSYYFSIVGDKKYKVIEKGEKLPHTYREGFHTEKLGEKTITTSLYRSEGDGKYYEIKHFVWNINDEYVCSNEQTKFDIEVVVNDFEILEINLYKSKTNEKIIGEYVPTK